MKNVQMRGKQTNGKFHRMEKEKGLGDRTDKKKEVEVKTAEAEIILNKNVPKGLNIK